MHVPSLGRTVARASGLVRQGVDARRSVEQIRQLQDARLRRLVRHVDRRVPFYRELWRAAGIDVRAIRSRDDLASLPPVRKRDLLGRSERELLADGVDPARCARSSSSGATGSPLTVYALPAERTAMNLGWLRAYLAHGLRPWHRLAAFVGRRGGTWRVRGGVFPRTEISAWLEPSAWVEALRAWRPHAVTGYVMTLRLLAEHMREHGVDDIRPRVVFHSSAVLDGDSRRLLEETFRCPVVDIYGSEEAGCIAWECPRCRGYHVNADLVVVEVLDGGRQVEPGGEGEAVITNLSARAMPFIRYCQDDVVRLSGDTAVCGRRSLPLIARIEGRTDDFLVLGGGRRMSPHPFYHCVDPVPGVQRWRIVQEVAGSMRLELQADPSLSPDATARIARDIEDLTRGDMSLEIVSVGAIAVDPGAKFRSVVSRAGRSTS